MRENAQIGATTGQCYIPGASFTDRWLRCQCVTKVFIAPHCIPFTTVPPYPLHTFSHTRAYHCFLAQPLLSTSQNVVSLRSNTFSVFALHPNCLWIAT